MENITIRKNLEKEGKNKENISQLRTEIREILEKEIQSRENIVN